MKAGRLRYAVIGIQGIGRHHVEFARANPRVELAALVDRDERAVRARAAEVGVRAFVDHRELLDAGLVDAVSIATPHRHLAPIGRDCLAAGLHILVEKPFATRVSEARALNRLAEERGLHVGVAFQYRTFPAARRLRELLDDGALGRLTQGTWRWAEFRPDAYHRRSPWRSSWSESGGGLLMNQASHDLDLLCWLLGPAVGVSARLANQLHETELEDAVTAAIEFPGGVQVAFQATINEPGTIDCRLFSGDRGTVAVSGGFGSNSEVRVAAFEPPAGQAVRELPGGHDQPRARWGRPRAAGLQRWLRRVPGIARWAAWRRRMRPEGAVGHQAIVDRFVDAALGHGEPLVSGRDAAHTVELINGMVLSSFERRWVDLPLDEQAHDRLHEALCTGEARVPRWR